MGGFDAKLMPALEAELEYFQIDDTPNLPAEMISWHPTEKADTIQLSGNNQIASSADDAGWHVALGTAPVTYIKYRLNSACTGNSCLVGLAPATRSLTGGLFMIHGYYIGLADGYRCSQQRDNTPQFGAALAANESIEFRYDVPQKAISVRYGTRDYQQVWANVTGELTACVELCGGPHSIEIVASET
jgi:hypothetical protein